jgi:hypothetical protein
MRARPGATFGSNAKRFDLECVGKGEKPWFFCVSVFPSLFTYFFVAMVLLFCCGGRLYRGVSKEEFELRNGEAGNAHGRR